MLYPWDNGERNMMTPSETEFSAASLGRLTDGLALIVCAAHALRSIEDMGADVAAVRSTLRQGIVQAQQAASELGLDLLTSYGADQGS